jgi:hypothetical protein
MVRAVVQLGEYTGLSASALEEWRGQLMPTLPTLLGPREFLRTNERKNDRRGDKSCLLRLLDWLPATCSCNSVKQVVAFFALAAHYRLLP